MNIFDKGFFRLAKAASLHSTYKVKVGCVLVLHGRPIAVGFNVCKTHPTKVMGMQQTIHAEIKAMMTAQTDLHGAIAYVYREYKNGQPALARPCNYCYQALLDNGVKTIYYTVSEQPYWKQERLK